MTNEMTRRQEHDFYADPNNQTVYGPARRRNPKLSDPADSDAGISNRIDKPPTDGFGPR